MGWAELCGRWAVLACVGAGLFAAPALAGHRGMSSSLEWAEDQIAANRVADFNERCGVVDAVRQPDPCRTVTADLLRDILFRGRGAGSRRLDVAHAVVAGDLDWSDADISREVSIENSLINGNVDLSRASFASRLSLSGTTVVGKLDASGARLSRDLLLRHAKLHELVLNDTGIGGLLSLDGAAVEAGVSMHNTRLGADFDLNGASLQQDLVADGVRVDGRIYARDLNAAGKLSFNDSTTTGDVWIEGGRLDSLWLDSAKIGSTLHLIGDLRVAREVVLSGAEIAHYWDVSGAAIAGALTADGLHVQQRAVLKALAVGGPVSLSNAHFDEDVLLDESSAFRGAFVMNGARIEGGLTAARVTWTRPPQLRLVRVAQDLDISGAVLPGLDLSGAQIGGALRLSGGAGRAATWSDRTTRCDAGGAGCLRLLNAKAGVVEGGAGAWPAHLRLSGFTYDRVFIDDSLAGWTGWLGRDSYSPQHYQQLATVLMADGKRDEAWGVQYTAREQERHEACSSIDRGFNCVFLTAMWATAGYGIGDYTWRVMLWVVALTALGAIFVWHAHKPPGPPGKLRALARRVFFAIGASLERILPGVKLDKSFTQFFEDQNGFSMGHKIVFTALALIGSVLGLFLAAAASGLTQKG